MSGTDIWASNRVVLAHFDSYSCALVFAKFGRSLLLPEPLAEGTQVEPPAEVSPVFDREAVLAEAVAKYGLKPEDVKFQKDYDEWLQTSSGLVRIHLLRFFTFLAPKEAIEPYEGRFLPISELRGLPKVDLNVAKGVFNLILGGNQKTG